MKFILTILTFWIHLGLLIFQPAAQAGTPQTVLVTTFPIYQMVRNVAAGHEGVTVDLLLPGQLGCPHDYALTPQDMQKLAKADLLVVNGLGLEEFLGAPVKKANPQITIIDSSTGIQEIIDYSEEKDDDHHERHDHEHHHEHQAQDHSHDGMNPHLFASPRMAARLVMKLAAELSKADPQGAALYFRNAQTYATVLNTLADAMADLGKRLKNNRIVQPHGIFDYLARDMGLEIVAVLQEHGQEPSAAEMQHIVATIREQQAGAIVIEPQYPEKVGRTVAKETGVPVALLDPVASGPENAPLNYYETVMRQNLKTLESTLGVK